MALAPRKLFLIAAASSLSCVSPVAAQQTTPTPQQQPSAEPHEQMQAPERSQAQSTKAVTWSADKLLDADIHNPQGDEIGEIEDLLIDDQGRIAAVVVETGGFLGLGSKKVELPFGELKLERRDDGDIRVRSEATAEQLQAAPEYRGRD